MTGRGDLRDAEYRRLEEAAVWQLRLSEAGARSTSEFEAWLREPGSLDAWKEISGAWAYFDHVADAPELAAARAAAWEDAQRAGMPVEETTRRIPSWAALAAAALVIGLTGVSGYWWSTRPDDYRTAIGERRVVTLADGSRLSLDANSEVTVRYRAHDRALHLLKGQARFDVAHDKSRPFSVVAGNQKVIATGTAFNIDMAGTKVLVTLIEGHVVVLDEADGSSSMPRAHSIELRAGQQMIAGPAVPPEILPVNLERVTAWTVGHVVFDDEPLSSVVARINRYGGTQVVIADPQVGAMKISGVFNTGDVPGFVEIVTHYLPVRAVPEDAHTIALQSQTKKSGAL